MIRIAITEDAFDAITATLPFVSVGYGAACGFRPTRVSIQEKVG